MSELGLSQILRHIENKIPYEKIGKIVASRGMVYEASVPRAILGSNVEFVAENGERSLGEVVAIQGQNCMVMPYNEISGINSETKIHLRDIVTEINISSNMLGRVIDFQ
jgi:flagellum-specific ATP synthase